MDHFFSPAVGWMFEHAGLEGRWPVGERPRGPLAHLSLEPSEQLRTRKPIGFRWVRWADLLDTGGEVAKNLVFEDFLAQAGGQAG